MTKEWVNYDSMSDLPKGTKLSISFMQSCFMCPLTLSVSPQNNCSVSFSPETCLTPQIIPLPSASISLLFVVRSRCFFSPWSECLFNGLYILFFCLPDYWGGELGLKHSPWTVWTWKLSPHPPLWPCLTKNHERVHTYPPRSCLIAFVIYALLLITVWLDMACCENPAKQNFWWTAAFEHTCQIANAGFDVGYAEF